MTERFIKCPEETTILVVDDSIENLKLLEGMLGGVGYRVRPALDGITALKAAAVSPPDLIFLDITMPGMDGFEVCRRLKKDTDLCDIPVIFISALTETAEKIQAFDCGGVDYVTKPFQFKEVQARLETHLALHDLRQSLEMRVRQRTSELEKANQKLQHEMAERKKAADEKQELEQRLRQNEKMESLGIMAGSISHDFNNLITPIIAYAQLLQSRLDDDDSKNQKCLEEIVKACRRGHKMITRILAFSREEIQEKEPLDFPALLREVVRQLRVSLPDQITMVSLLDLEDCMVLADATQLHQVIMNLGVNACHAMAEKGGILTFAVDRISVEPVEQDHRYKVGMGNYVRLEVRDTGSGIVEENLDQIFKPFFTTREKGKGTGFGLSQAQSILKHLDGAITVSSTPGKGSCFTVLLPEIGEKAVETVQQGGTEKSKQDRKVRILLVHADRVISLMFTEMLKTADYIPVICASGARALKRLRQQPEGFDLVLADMSIPDMGGREFSSRLQELACDLPVIILSGNHEALDQQQLDALGIHRQLRKPVTAAILLAAVDEALGQE